MARSNGPDFTRIRPVRGRVRLPRPVHDVFAFVGNPCNDPQWVDYTPHVVQTDGDGPVIGATYEYEQTVGWKATGQITITDMAAPAFMAFRVEDSVRVYRVEYRLKTKGDGCIFEQSSYPWFKTQKLQRNAWLIRLLMRKQMRKQMKALKQAMA